MKVLQITNSLLSGGAEKLVTETTIRFRQKGVQADVLLLDGSATPFLQKLQRITNVSIFTFSNANSKGYSIYNPLAIFKIRKLLIQYDIIHVHLFPALYWTAIANWFCLSKNIILITEHNTTNRRRNYSLFRFLDRIIYKQFSEIITISDAVDQSLKNHLGSGFKNFIKIYNGIDLDTISKALPYPKSKFGIAEDKVVLLQVASFTPQKDQETLLNAVSILPPNFVLLLVGDGPLRVELMDKATALSVRDRVQFLGIRSDVPRLLKTADIVVLSSHYEGLSLSSVEGMASGKPFVASDVPGLTEVVKGAGKLFEDSNEIALKNNILLLANDPDCYQKTVQLCQEKSKQFDIHQMVKRYIERYHALQ